MAASLKLVTAATILAFGGMAGSVVASGQSTEEVVIASLAIVPGEATAEVGYPHPRLGVARSLELMPAAPALTPAEEMVPAEDLVSPEVSVPEAQPQAAGEEVAAVYESETYQEYLAINGLSAVPLPTPRPDLSADVSSADQPVMRQVQPRRSVQAAPTRRIQQVAQADEPRRRMLRANPIMLGAVR